MEKGHAWSTPQQLEVKWQQKADSLLQPLPPKTIKYPRLHRLQEGINTSWIGKTKRKMSLWPQAGANWLIEKVNGPLQERMDNMEKNPALLPKVLEQTVFTELTATRRRMENKRTTKFIQKLPWVVAGAGFIPAAGTFITMGANLFNAGRAAIAEHNPRKAGLYLLFVPLNPALGLLSIIPGIGWIFFPPAILTNSIFVEEMSKKYKIALTEGQLEIAQQKLSESSELRWSIENGIKRFEDTEEKRSRRGKHKKTARSAQEIAELQLQKEKDAEKEAQEKTATQKNKRKLIQVLKQSENTKLLLSLIQSVNQNEAPVS